jgi:hypothetical protein
LNAGRILRRSGYDTDALRRRIAPVNPEDINIWPASTSVQRLWRSGIRGVTFGRLVFIDVEVFRGDPDRLARLVIHELVHIRQFVAVGYLRFMTTYLKEYWMGRMGGKSPREAYLDIAFEREARDLTALTVAAM